jgi:ApaG protein
MDKANRPQATPAQIDIRVVSTYLRAHTRPEQQQFAFAYTITISNRAEQTVQLLSRHWIITDAEGAVQEVQGEGVVGEQPVIAPGESFRYTSGATLTTPVGCMEGSYTMARCDDGGRPLPDGNHFDVPIPAFSLHTPTALH